ERRYMTLGDYVSIAIGPVLIMLLVGSLVFFLTDLVYGGEYSARLLWILFWFVVGMVLIARMHIEMGGQKAKFYCGILGPLVYIALLKFVEYPEGTLAACAWLINLLLLGVIWWATHRLTWDSTHIDDEVDASGLGVLEAAGLDDDGSGTSAAGYSRRSAV